MGRKDLQFLKAMVQSLTPVGGMKVLTWERENDLSDNAGNLTSTYGGTHTKVLTWGEGRMLLGVRKSTTNYTEYTYNADGLRTQKIVVEDGASTTTQYIWGNNGLAAIIIGDTTVVPIYDSDGEAVGFFVEETEEYTPAIPDAVTQKVYTYVKNLQGDVNRIYRAM